MKTFLAVVLYATMVAALDLGGAVWHSVYSAYVGKASVATTAHATPTTKTGSAIRAVGTIPSDS